MVMVTRCMAVPAGCADPMSRDVYHRAGDRTNSAT
jgi:hypothetical protein